MNRTAWIVVSLLAIHLGVLWYLGTHDAPWDVLGLWATLPVWLPLGLLAVAHSLAWVARRLGV